MSLVAGTSDPTDNDVWQRGQPPRSYHQDVWTSQELADRAADTLKLISAQRDTEQSVRGIDALTEVELHPYLADAFVSLGLTVLREQPYPGAAGGKRLRDVLRRDRLRCDLVLLPAGGRELADEVHDEREVEELAGSLFLSPALADRDRRGRVRPGEAQWIEVKLVSQFTIEHGGIEANSAYSSDLTRGPEVDIAKLARAAGIEFGALMIILFTADEATADHDLGVLVHRCLDKGLDIASPATARFPITDRLGNRFCTVSVIRVKRSKGRDETTPLG